jgi:integrase
MPREARLRDYLTRDEVASVLRSAKKSPRYGARNHAMILLAYRHGLRASELVNLRVSDIDLRTGTIYCRRAKGSRSSLHPMKPDEVVALQNVLQQRKLQTSDYVFQSERAERMSRSAFWRIVAQAGERTGLPVKADAPVATQLRPFLGEQGVRLAAHSGLPGAQADSEHGAVHGAQSREVRGIVVGAQH